MADFTSIAATGNSIVRFLDFCFRERQPIAERNTNVILVRTEDLNREPPGLITMPALTLFLYRIDFNKTMRAAWSAVGHSDGDSHLPVDLHFLLIAWAENADHEYRILGRAMQCLENVPILSGPILDPLTDWSEGDAVQICLEDLSTEDVMRTFDSLPVDYKLSMPYVARIIVIDGHEAHPDLPITKTTTRIRGEVDI